MKVGDLVRVVDADESFVGMLALVFDHVNDPELGYEWFFRVLDLEDTSFELDYYEWQLEVVSEGR